MTFCAPSPTRSRLGSAAAKVSRTRGESFEDGGMVADDGNRQIAKARFFREHGEQRFDHARVEPFADDHAVDVARFERARRALDGERANDPDMFVGGGPARLDDRIRAGRAQRFDDVAGRLIGNDGEGTLQRHGGVDGARAWRLAKTAADLAKVLLTAR